ncbi:MAG: hypothetical protein V2A76_01680, partial [Planctomycetota bacterium]
MKKVQARKSKAPRASIAPETMTRSAAKKTAATGTKKRPAVKKKAKSAATVSRKPATRRAGGDDLDLPSIERLVQLMADNDLLEVEVRNGPNHRVRLSRRPPKTPQLMIAAQGQSAPPP